MVMPWQKKTMTVGKSEVVYPKSEIFEYIMNISRFFFFALIPVGVVVLILTIRLLKKSFAGKVISEVPYAQKVSFFRIKQPGVYSIWQKGQFFRKLPVDQFRPVIINNVTEEKVPLIPSLFRPNSNDGNIFKMELFRFTATSGMYRLELTEGSSISGVESFISRIFPAKKADLSQYYILIRESQPFYFVIIGILLLCLAGFMMIGGLVFGILDIKTLS
jgi:hypothetical protein